MNRDKLSQFRSQIKSMLLITFVIGPSPRTFVFGKVVKLPIPNKVMKVKENQLNWDRELQAASSSTQMCMG